LRGIAGLAAELVVEAVPRPEADALVFVPPDASRRLQRGHHPAEGLADRLGRRWELPVLPLVERASAGRRQRGLTLAERRKNVAGVFGARGRAPPRIVLVDDIYTSGATASAVGSALRSAGARRVEVVTLARAVR